MIKPILFNTDMVRAILEDRKTVTRRVVKPQLETECSYGGQHKFIQDDFIEGTSFTGFVCRKCGYGVCGPHFKFPIGTSWIRPPYHPGDILYVRETFWQSPNGEYTYKSDYNQAERLTWHPSIHMPREAARIFLQVTDVRVERLQEITPEQLRAEGAKLFVTPSECKNMMNRFGAVCDFERKKKDFSTLWDSTLKKADRALYGWQANPWVWVIEFERCEKPEGD